MSISYFEKVFVIGNSKKKIIVPVDPHDIIDTFGPTGKNGKFKLTGNHSEV